jgi:hypothetical protein
MADEINIKIDIDGIEELTKAIAQYPKMVGKYMGAAGQEAVKKGVFYERGLKKYPPETDANRPPTPFYIRTIGTQYKSYNMHNSENLGKQWYVNTEDGGFTTRVGNRASYAEYVVGEGQAFALGRKGWLKLMPTVYRNYQKIKFIYDAWVEKLLKDISLT